MASLQAALQVVLLAGWLGASGSVMAQPAAYPGIGRAATPAEVAAWDIDVRPDFKGLPAGSGSVQSGMAVWESKCASCHGVFGESNQFFAPLVGGTTASDVASGRAARLDDPAYPGRTTLMKLSSLSSLWDYIRRAMPWNNPKSLSDDEVYAVTAYLLNLGDIVPATFVLSDRNMAEAQQRLPNRNGMTTVHGLWPGRPGAPDVASPARPCMQACATDVAITSSMPDAARGTHGNLAAQNRRVGAQRGIDTSRDGGGSVASSVASSAANTGETSAVRSVADPSASAGATSAAGPALVARHGCTLCHAAEVAVVGPGFRQIAQKYEGRRDAIGYLAAKMRAGSSGVWGSVAMPPQTLPDADAQALAGWLAGGARP